MLIQEEEIQWTPQNKTKRVKHHTRIVECYLLVLLSCMISSRSIRHSVEWILLLKSTCMYIIFFCFYDQYGFPLRISQDLQKVRKIFDDCVTSNFFCFYHSLTKLSKNQKEKPNKTEANNVE